MSHIEAAGPDVGIALSGIAADLDKLAVYVTALDYEGKLKLLAEHGKAMSTVRDNLQRTINALNAADRKRKKAAIAARQKETNA